MRSLDLLEINRRVMQYTITHPYERDCWEKATAISGVLAWDDGPAVEGVRAWIDRAVETQTSSGDLNYNDTLDLPAGHVRTFTPTASLSSALGYPLMRFYERTRDSAYLKAAGAQADGLLRTPRTAEGGVWARKEGPELWVDFLYMMCPFLIAYGTACDQASYVDEAFKQYRVHVKRLVDPHEGLARHAWCERPNHYPQSTFWARGNGWLLCCSVDMLAQAQKHPEAGPVVETARRTLEAMAAFQDRCGFFHHVLDDVSTKFEASATLMFSYAATRMVQLGLAEESYLEHAERALRVVAGSVGADGAVPGVAVPPGGPGVPFGTTLFGQGFFMLAAHALRDRLAR